MPGYLFWFTLRKADGVDLGLQLCDTHARALCIRHVWPYGAVHLWNKLCAGARPEVEIKASKQQNILKGNCKQKVDRNLVCRLANQKRKHLRKQLFSGESKNTPGKKLDKQEWLVPNWEVYVKLNFELPKVEKTRERSNDPVLGVEKTCEGS